jgi:hypothetical protein
MNFPDGPIGPLSDCSLLVGGVLYPNLSLRLAVISRTATAWRQAVVYCQLREGSLPRRARTAASLQSCGDAARTFPKLYIR